MVRYSVNLFLASHAIVKSWIRCLRETLTMYTLMRCRTIGQFAAEKNFNMSGSETRGSPRVEFLSWQPRVFYHHNFLTDSEISYLTDGNLNMTAGSIKPFTGNGKWFEDILARLARFTQEPIANFEQGFFSKYDPGHDTEPRRDWYEKRKKSPSPFEISFWGLVGLSRPFYSI